MSPQPASFAVCDAAHPEEAAQWIAAWEAWPRREVYAHPHYARLYTDGITSRALCAVWCSSAGSVLYPFILRSLQAEPWWQNGLPPLADIVTPYGYGGPFAWDVQDPQALQEAFWAAFDEWAGTAHVISEFIRFSLFSETLLPYPGECDFKLHNVVCALDADEDTLWMDFKHKVRKNVKRAQKSGVQVEHDPSAHGLEDFLRIYRQTLDRRSASDRYYFSEEYLTTLTAGLPGQFMFFHARLNGTVISTELVLVSAENVYSFLGGTDEAYFEVRPNDLLKYEIIRWAKANHKKRFVLGGGYSDKDGIFKYKESFAPQGIMPFSVGMRILNPAYYAQLVQNRQAADPGWTPDRAFFPLYRA